MNGSKMEGVECTALENNFLRLEYYMPNFAQINETRDNIFDELNEVMIDIDLNNSFNNLNNLGYNEPLTGRENVEFTTNADSKEREQKFIQARWDHDYSFPYIDASMDLCGSNITKKYNNNELETTIACGDIGNTEQFFENSRINAVKNEMQYDNQLHTESPFCEIAACSFSDVHMDDINSFNETNPVENNFRRYDYEIMLPHFVVASNITSNKPISVKEIEQNSDSDGYNSSDFELITESEARQYGLITNKSSNVDARRRLKKRRINEGNDQSIPSNNQTMQREIRGHNNVDFHVINRSIPQYDDYYNLFQGYHSPTVIHSWQNKAIDYNSINNAMLVEPDSIGFDMKVLNAKNKEKHTFSSEVLQEADETFKKILDMYPSYNKKTKRPRLF